MQRSAVLERIIYRDYKLVIPVGNGCEAPYYKYKALGAVGRDGELSHVVLPTRVYEGHGGAHRERGRGLHWSACCRIIYLMVGLGSELIPLTTQGPGSHQFYLVCQYCTKLAADREVHQVTNLRFL